MWCGPVCDGDLAQTQAFIAAAQMTDFQSPKYQCDTDPGVLRRSGGRVYGFLYIDFEQLDWVNALARSVVQGDAITFHVPQSCYISRFSTSLLTNE